MSAFDSITVDLEVPVDAFFDYLGDCSDDDLAGYGLCRIERDDTEHAATSSGLADHLAAVRATR